MHPNSLKSPFLPSQILCNFLGIFPQIFLPPESLYSISNRILIHKSIKIDFLLLYLISAREMVSARPPPLFSSPAAAHLLPPCPAQSARRLLRLSVSAVACDACPFWPSPAPLVRFGRRLPLSDRSDHPVSEPGVITFIEQRPRHHCSLAIEHRPAPRLGCHRTVTTSPSFPSLKYPLKPSPVFNGLKAINTGIKLPSHHTPALPQPL
jgi:hypothetical protein